MIIDDVDAHYRFLLSALLYALFHVAARRRHAIADVDDFTMLPLFMLLRRLLTRLCYDAFLFDALPLSC